MKVIFVFNVLNLTLEPWRTSESTAKYVTEYVAYFVWSLPEEWQCFKIRVARGVRHFPPLARHICRPGCREVAQ